MNRCRWFLGWGSVFVVVSQFLIGLAQAAAPPLKPNEEIVKTKDGCGMVIDKTVPAAKYVREAFSNLTWGGACIDGLAMGEGILFAGAKFPDQPTMLPLTGWAWYGRTFGSKEQRWDNGSVQKNFTWEGKTAFYKTLDVSAPVWSKVYAESSKVSDGDVMVSTMMGQKPVVFVTEINNSKSQQHPCPDASPANCQALWAQHAGPVIERIKAFLAQNEPKANARMAEVQPLVAAWKAKVGPAVVAKREADAKRGAGEQFDKQAKQAEWDKGCWDKLNKAPTLFDPGLTSENNTKRARYLQTLFKGECAGHTYAENALKEADQLLAKVPELQKQEGVTAKYEKEQKEQREKDKKETAELLAKVAGAAIAGKNSSERKQNVLNALGGGSVAEGGLGNDRCLVEDMQPFESYNYSPKDYVSYKPLDCISVEWRNKAKVTDKRQSGLEARIVNQCPCGIQFRHVGTLRGIDDDVSIITASSTTTWHSELSEDKKFEIIPESSCHYTDEIQALYHVKTKRCVARKCKDHDRYGNCGYATTK
jgi:hypothetical protein